MRKVIFSDSVLARINQYAENYRAYFEDTWTDTGIWSESIIRNRYCELAYERAESLAKSIADRLSSDIVIGHNWNQSVTIPWRQKNLNITWYDVEKARIVETIEIH